MNETAPAEEVIDNLDAWISFTTHGTELLQCGGKSAPTMRRARDDAQALRVIVDEMMSGRNIVGATFSVCGVKFCAVNQVDFSIMATSRNRRQNCVVMACPFGFVYFLSKSLSLSALFKVGDRHVQKLTQKA